MTGVPRTTESAERPGMHLGLTNTLTRVRALTASTDVDLDAKPGRYETLLQAAHRAMAGDVLFIHDVVIHGVRVRAALNSRHLADFWRDQFTSIEEWKQITGIRPADRPDVWVYAFVDVPGRPESASYSRSHDTVFLFNTSYYEQLRSWALGAVARVLAETQGIQSTQGGVIQRHGRGVLLLGREPGPAAFGAALFGDARILAWDRVFIRYAYRRRNGQFVSPIQVAGLTGFRCFRWIEQNTQSAGTKLRVLTFDNQIFETTVADLDLESFGAYAFSSEKHHYVPTRLLRLFPELARSFLSCKLENIDEAPPGQEAIPLAGGLVAAGRIVDKPSILRLCGETGRALLATERVVGKDRLGTSPIRLDYVFAPDAGVAPSEPLSLEGFGSTVLRGTLDPHRLADTKAETEYVKSLEEETNRLRAGSPYRVHVGRVARGAAVPEVLAADLELFRALFRATRCFTLTIPQALDDRDALMSALNHIFRLADDLPSRAKLASETPF